jgi:2-polyprenyl-6-methoxyphenol hydroxylase-like FAD-dependent oxidoreductase
MTTRDRVLIAGAGPVGMVAAANLVRHGVPVTVLEANATLSEESRASTFHPPTLDMLDGLGVTGGLIAQGLIAPTWQYRDRAEGPVAIFDMGLLKDDTGHPYRVQCEQWKLTRLLYDALGRYPHAEIRFGHRAIDVSQDADRAVLALETPEGPVELAGRYVIAADGARSVLRKALDIGFEGFTFPERFLVVSTPFEFADRLPRLSYINYLSDPEEWLVLLRVKEFLRVLLPTGADEDDSALLSDAGIDTRLQRVVASGRPYDVVHRTLYHVHQRVAARYRAGRVFLAGDAAHINNPLGGMGMNGGIHDALNLTEKLAEVLGGADAALLDRYERQRRPIAIEYVQQATVRNREVLNERDPAVRRRALDELRGIAEDPVKAREFLLRSSMIASLRKAASLD